MWHLIERWTRRLRRDEAGQSIYIIGLALFTLLVIIGLAVDLGLMYVERVKLGRACDAAALAAAQDLPFEEFAARRAIEYLIDNGYDQSNAYLLVEGPSADSVAKIADAYGWPPPPDPDSRELPIITLHMEEYENPDLKRESSKNNSADKIRVHGRVRVPMHFMQLIGFKTVPVEAQAVAENVSYLDVIIVYDESGSMDDDTFCYAQNRDDRQTSEGKDIPEPCYSKPSDVEYPTGNRMFLPYEDSKDLVTGDPVVTAAGEEILVAEAEFFYRSSSIGGDHDYHRDANRPVDSPVTYWVLQRTKDSQASGFRYEAGDRRGAHLMHMPHTAHTLGHNKAHKDDPYSPRLDYRFELPSVGTWYVWIRAQCGQFKAGGTLPDGETYEGVDSCVVHGGVDGKWKWSTKASDFGSDPHGGKDGGSNGDQWVWVRLGSFKTKAADETREVNIWGGGAGFRLDKVLVTRNLEDEDTNYVDRAPLFIREATPEWADVKDDEYQSYYVGPASTKKRYGGPPDSGGRTDKDDMALWECNPFYGRLVDLNGDGDGWDAGECDNRYDDAMDDLQPLRAAKEAAKNFVRRMRARYDQIGFVPYSTKFDQEFSRELNCILTPARAGVKPLPDFPGDYDPDTGDPAWIWCFDHRQGNDGYSDPNRSPDTTHGSIIGGIEDMESYGYTNIADGMRVGLEFLQPGGGHYARPQSAKVMIVMTDGIANRYPGCEKTSSYWPSCAKSSCVDKSCKDDTLWPPDKGKYPDYAYYPPYDSVMYYANQAELRDVLIYTIGLGVEVDGQLLLAVADKTGGAYFHAQRAEELNEIFQEIADRIFLRLVQ